MKSSLFHYLKYFAFVFCPVSKSASHVQRKNMHTYSGEAPVLESIEPPFVIITLGSTNLEWDFLSMDQIDPFEKLLDSCKQIICIHTASSMFSIWDTAGTSLQLSVREILVW